MQAVWAAGIQTDNDSTVSFLQSKNKVEKNYKVHIFNRPAVYHDTCYKLCDNLKITLQL